MTKSRLTEKQAYYLKRFLEAQVNGQSLRQLADQEQVNISLLYNYRYVLRRKGALDPVTPKNHQRNPVTSSFNTVPLSSPVDSKAESTIE